MTSTLPDALREVFDHFVTTEYVTIDAHGQPIAWPVTPYHHAERGCIDVTTGLGYPKKAVDAEHNPRVALLFSDPTGSALDDPPMVLVQGTARVDDRDLESNRRRYEAESAAKLPATQGMQPPKPLRRLMNWYYLRLYVHVRPERVWAWPEGDLDSEPALYGAHLEEVRTAANAEPIGGHVPPEGGGTIWHPRLEELGIEYATAVLAVVGPDGFPFAARMPVRADPGERLIWLDADPEGAPFEPGLACVTAHAHSPDFTWQRNFQVRGDLLEVRGRWALAPHKLVGGFELPPVSAIERYRLNARKMSRYRRVAKLELARRGG